MCLIIQLFRFYEAYINVVVIVTLVLVGLFIFCTILHCISTFGTFYRLAGLSS